MDLVGFGLTVHDSSVAAYKDGKFLYRKAERQFNQKHAHGNMEWALSVLKEWEITEYESAEATQLKGKNKQKLKEGNKLDYHYAQSLSSSKQTNVDVVLGNSSIGPADKPEEEGYYTGLIKVGTRQVDRFSERPIPEVLNTLVRSNYFNNETDVRKFITESINIKDYAKQIIESGKTPSNWEAFIKTVYLPEKIMHLQGLGKPNEDKLNEWLRHQYRNLMVISESIHNPPDKIDANFISTVHKFCEANIIQRLPPMEFSYSGTCAQNAVWNRAIIDSYYKPHIEPWSYEAGCSIGALNYLLDKHNIERHNDWVQDDEAPDDEPDGLTVAEVAELISQNKVVGWYQGHGEVGLRSLGNRSILFNPANKDAKEIVNKIKQREWWRSFGASVLEEKAPHFFDLPVSRHRLFNSKVLYSGIPGVTHVDGTCIHQTVPDEDTPIQWLLTYVEMETDLPVVLNTSLNKPGKPLCSTIDQAMDLFNATDMDAICIGNEVYKK